MAETNPIAFAAELRAVLARYIATTLPISRRYPKLRTQFREVLANQQLLAGPFVEALPDFEKGKSVLQLLRSSGGYLDDALAKIQTAARPLHKHQEEALRAAVVEQLSFLTATGTGSGKTETFLYPIAHALLSEKDPRRPGVRALLVYPMNALANDQLYYRIAPLFARYLLDHGVTFGRYTGQVKAGARRDEEEAKLLNNPKLMEALGGPAAIPKNWMLTRDEMLADPPKILITNYAMLEHLLLLPRNAGLFATNALRFVVLDEVHTYTGAQATEVAYLLRKLKTRLGIDRLQVFGTSASLADGPDADRDLIQFGSDLLGEDVRRVIRGRRIPSQAFSAASEATYSLSAQEWQSAGALLREFIAQPRNQQTVRAWNDAVGVATPSLSRLKADGGAESSVWPALVPLLAGNLEVRQVASALDGGRVVHFAQLATTVFGKADVTDTLAEAALSAVIQIGMAARPSDGEFPLLPGRYHIAVNSIEGLVALPVQGGEGWAKLRAGRNFSDEDGQYFPLLTCRKCGQPFLEGWKDGGRIVNRRPDTATTSRRMVFWLGEPFGGTEDEEDELESGEPTAAHNERLFIDLKTGDIVASESAVPMYPVQTVEDNEERAVYVQRCPACGGRSTGAEAEVVTRMHPGNEALGAVVTQRVLEALPVGLIDNAHPRPSLGRTLLTFSDNRQDAAFFAPYFERTAASVALRSAVRHALSEQSSPASIPQLADKVYQLWRRDGGQPLLLDALGDIKTDKQDVTALLQGALGFEFCTPGGRRNSLESLGVAQVTYEEARLQPLLQQVSAFWPAGLPQDAQSQSALVHMLLETVRRDRALAQLHTVPMDDASVWGDYNQHRTFDIEAGDKGARFRWLPGAQSSRHNRRTWYLVEQLGLPRSEALDFLRRIWQVMTRQPVGLMKLAPPGFGLDGNAIRVQDGVAMPLYQCINCGLFQRHVLMGKCSAFQCKGDVVELGHGEREALRAENHYLATYDERSHLTVRAREHTASLSTELREDIEREFSERRLNLLSCTTTMEMGVDLGDLEAIVNLNVPPGIANYQQRTGRAGRRAQAAPFCVTVARNMNYDQAVFRDLHGYLSRSPATPFVHLANAELFLRHQTSVALAHFFRAAIADRTVNAPSLKHLFGDVLTADGKNGFFDKLYAWVESPEGVAGFEEAEALARRLPARGEAVAADGPQLRSAVVGRLREFAEDVAERCHSYGARMEEAKASDQFAKAEYWKKQREQYMDQFLVTELSRRGLIPTYSFPVHSLTLEVQDGTKYNKFRAQADVALSRDATFGISEYAPGAEVVANGRIWESAGVARYPKAFMPERWYVACEQCFHVDVGDTSQDLADACTNCGSTDGRRRRRFIEPKGFVTSAENKRGKDPGSSRRRVKPADEARLIAAPRADQFEETELPFLQTALLPARGGDEGQLRGTLFVANRGSYGEGYFRCTQCNFCRPFKSTAAGTAAGGKGLAKQTSAKAAKHSDPATGQACPNDFMPRMGLDFAHTFSTDVRLLRFMAPLPETGEDGGARRRQERIARTVAEAFRLAASDLLSLQSGQLRSTYRLYNLVGATLEVVLYDGVPGGAGYAGRIGSPKCSFSNLVAAAQARLQCPAGCESACRACLCDYANQRYWDNFERKAALAWLHELGEGRTLTDGPGRYVPWLKPTLRGLAERLANFGTISFIAPRLTSADGYSEADLNAVIGWLQSGKKLRVYVSGQLDSRPRDYATLMVYRHLYPWVQQGALALLTVEDLPPGLAAVLPRIFAGTNDGAPIVRQKFAVQPLFQSILAAPVELGEVDAEVRSSLERLLASAKALAKDHLAEGPKMAMWEFLPGTARNLADVFAAIRGVHIKRLAIRDPYCGSSVNRRRIGELVRFLLSHASAVDKVDVYCSETKTRDGEIEFKHDIARALEKLLSEAGVASSDAFVRELKGSSRGFHDRELRLEVADGSGSDVTHRYFLTGGVDYLLNERSETRVFHVVD